MFDRVLKLWKLRKLTLAGFKNFFKTLALSKIIFQVFVTPILNNVVTELENKKNKQNRKVFLRTNSTSKVKRDTLCNDHKGDGLKNMVIWKIIMGLLCSWIKRLYDGLLHEWEIILFHLISNTFGKFLIFHSNLSFKENLIKSFPSFYKEILLNLKTFFSRTSETPSCILPQL